MIRSTMRQFIMITLPFVNHAFISTSTNTPWPPPYDLQADALNSPLGSDYRRASFVLFSGRFRGDERKERNKKRDKSKKSRKFWSKVLRKDTTRGSTLHMYSIDKETEALQASLEETYSDAFVFEALNNISSTRELPEVQFSGLDSEFYNISLLSEPPTLREGKAKRKSTNKGDKSFSRILSRVFENALTGVIQRNTIEDPENLTVKATTRGNLIGRLLRGQFSTDAKLSVGRIVFPNIRMSKCTLSIKRMTLNIMAFWPSSKTSVARFPRQFDLHAEDFTFSRHDLLFSKCIRNGLRRLLVRILRDRGVQSSSIKVTSLDILPSGKIACTGEARTLFGSPLSFEVRSAISSCSRGHVLTFPGLEVSLNRNIGLFVPVVPELDLDVGHNARFHNIDINGEEKFVRLNASVTITPESTILLHDYAQPSKAFAAKFSTDVGQWLTRIGNFSK